MMLANKLILIFCYFAGAGFILSSESYRVGGYTRPDENGTCTRLVVRNDELLYNQSKGLVEIVGEETIPGIKSTKTKSHSGWVTIRECCPGYTKNNETGKCDPHCEDGCVGGTCIGPNRCKCNEGLSLEFGECKPICSDGCQEHAYCFAPEKCSCEFGYTNVNGACRPVCLHECMNGDCVAPRECRCHYGYILNSTKHCEPICDSGCPYGNCESPEVCSCKHGYIHPPDSQGNCVPYCPDSCKNGMCHSPGVCTCNQGYVNADNGTCVPECIEGCENGECVAPEDCQCNVGFVMRMGKCVQIPKTTYPDLSQHIKHEQQMSQQEIYRSTQPQKVIELEQTNTDQKPYNGGVAIDEEIYDVQQEHETPTTTSYGNRQTHIGKAYTHTRPQEEYVQVYKQEPNLVLIDESYRLHANQQRLEGPPVMSTHEKKPEAHIYISSETSDSQETETQYTDRRRILTRYTGIMPGSKTVTVYEDDVQPTHSRQVENYHQTYPGSNVHVKSSQNIPYQRSSRLECNGTQLLNPEPYMAYLLNPCDPFPFRRHREESQITQGKCLNGVFYGQNKCRCNEGYKPSPRDEGVCVPECPGGCLNGECTSPNLCICNAGFVKQYGIKESQTCVAVD